MRITTASILILLTACGDDDAGTDDGTAPPTGDIDFADCVDGFCYLDNELSGDITLTSDVFWVLEGGVFVGGDNTDNSTLTIEPGTTIYGESATDGFLTIRRGSKIEAIGTEDRPIVFTSAVSVGSRARADWGGLILNGNAPINDCSSGTAVTGCEAEGEGGTGLYGGDDAGDSSGTLRYVRVEFGGTEISTENEVNGIAFQGVGSGTTVDHVQVHMNKDDGVEFFGGTVSASHLVLSGIGDDALDWTSGWTGSVDHVLVWQFSDAGDRGMECDNNGDVNNAMPFSNPTISNVTIVGAAPEAIGVLLRAGTKATLRDFAITGSPGGCLDVDDDQTWDNGAAGSLTMTNSVVSCPSNFEEDEDDVTRVVEDWFLGQTGNATAADLGLEDWMPTASSPLVGAGSGGGTAGAFEVGDDWTAGWTTMDAN